MNGTVSRAVGRTGRHAGLGVAAILLTAVLWGTTGTAATFAPGAGPLAIGAAALGVGGQGRIGVGDLDGVIVGVIMRVGVPVVVGMRGGVTAGREHLAGDRRPAEREAGHRRDRHRDVTVGCADPAGAHRDHAAGTLGDAELAPGLAGADHVGQGVQRPDLVEVDLGGGSADRSQQRSSLPASTLSEKGLQTLRGLDVIAKERGQTLAQMAIQWILRDPVVTSALIGASSVEQLDENLAAAAHVDFSTEELAAIDELATDAEGVDLWKVSADL